MKPLSCPQCGKQFANKPELAGKHVRCPGCKQAFQVPAAAPDLLPLEDDDDLRLAPKPAADSLARPPVMAGPPARKERNPYWEAYKRQQIIKGATLLILMVFVIIPSFCLCSGGLLLRQLGFGEVAQQPVDLQMPSVAHTEGQAVMERMQERQRQRLSRGSDDAERIAFTTSIAAINARRATPFTLAEHSLAVGNPLTVDSEWVERRKVLRVWGTCRDTTGAVHAFELQANMQTQQPDWVKIDGQDVYRKE